MFIFLHFHSTLARFIIPLHLASLSPLYILPTLGHNNPAMFGFDKPIPRFKNGGSFLVIIILPDTEDTLELPHSHQIQKSLRCRGPNSSIYERALAHPGLK